VGVIPFTILMDQVSSQFPTHTSLVIGIAFMAIVYGLPNGVLGRLEQLNARMRHSRRAVVPAAKQEQPA
jgi:branched-chain amino acid transport system permease protein